jgi:hypothetical protein
VAPHAIAHFRRPGAGKSPAKLRSPAGTGMETARYELTADCIRGKPLDAMIERARNSPCPLYPQKRTSELVTFGAISSGSFATFAAIRRAYYRLIIWKMGIQKLQTKNHRGNPFSSL